MRPTIRTFLLLGLALRVAAEPAAISGPQYVATVKAAKPKGGVYIRARLVQGRNVMQIQIKRRPIPGGSEQLYQVIFPRDRKGEALLLRSSGGSLSGSLAVPGSAIRPIGNGDRRMSVFGTDLTIEDLLVDFYDWRQQLIVGHETVGSTPCVEIESKPDRSGKGPSKVLSWIDEKRYVPIRVQIFDGGSKPTREVDTSKVIQLRSGYYIPATFTVSNETTGTSTLIEGSSSKDGVNYSDADFTEKAMQTVTPAPSGS